MVNIQFILVGLKCKGIPITEYFIIPITNGILAYSAMQLTQPTRDSYIFLLLIIYPSKCSPPERAQHRKCHSVLQAHARINHHLSREVAKRDTEIHGKTGSLPNWLVKGDPTHLCMTTRCAPDLVVNGVKWGPYNWPKING